MVKGNLRKMTTEWKEPVAYGLPLSDATVELNQYIGSEITLEFSGNINCVYCGRSIRKSFSQGYCFPCSQTLARCDMCIVKPELCHYHEGTCREPAWGREHCMIPHVVYLADSSAVKVGITRAHQMRTRWMDQGATRALPIIMVDTRKDAGEVEVALKDFVADKTNWRAMLQGKESDVDLTAKREELFDDLGDVDAYGEALDSEVYTIVYPIQQHPTKITSLNFDKKALVGGTLLGIKGQYLIFDSGVINMRKFGGYELQFREGAP